MKLLDGIDYPEDLRRLPRADLEALCQEIREFLWENVTATGGHLSSNLGIVELTVALHYVLDIGPDKDRLVFDVSHQAYVHKILTGRKRRFPTLRQTDGLCGFTSQYESPYDLFHVSHAGTAVSTALGYLAGRQQTGKEPGRVVALVGDAGIGAGMAFEALNHAGTLKDRDLLVILNDNQMSIAKSVGALVRTFDKVRASKTYVELKRDMIHGLEMIPVVGPTFAKWAEKVKEAIQHYMNPGLIFEELGFRYFGPVDGHDVQRLVSTFRDLKETRGPVLLHVLTQKGRGYEAAERDPTGYHGVKAKLKAPEPPMVKAQAAPPPPRTVSCPTHFGTTLCALAKEIPRIVAITAAMPNGTGLVPYAAEFPDRFFDVGICEQHAVAFAGGLAAGGALPVVAIYSTFLQRGYDQVVHDAALQSAHMVVCMDRAGVVGGDGMTANGAFDIAYLRAIPRTTLLAPGDAPEMEAMLRFALGHKGIVALRWPKANFSLVSLPGNDAPVRLGKAARLREGEDLTLLAYGAMAQPSLEAARLLEAEGVSAGVVNARFAKPVDADAVREAVERHALLVTVEDHALLGGFGSAVAECLVDAGLQGARVLRLGLPDKFIEHGNRDEILRRHGLGPAEIAARSLEELRRSVRAG
ncbi:MAG: 1-deoxy-D-xylulose-5-phosphate synthase [Planctomycetaceae bacterium]